MREQKPVFFLLYKSCVFKLNAGVFPPYHGSFLLERSVDGIKGTRVLDVGTGTGFFAVLSAKRGARSVTATDVVKESVKCAKDNSALNGVKDIVSVLRGSLFSAVKGKTFDVIFANVPILPSPEQKNDAMSIGRDGGRDGKQILYRMLEESPRCLSKGGRICFTHFNFTDVRATMNVMKKSGLSPKILAKEECPLSDVALERLPYLIELMKPTPIRKKGNKYVCMRYALCGIKM